MLFLPNAAISGEGENVRAGHRHKAKVNWSSKDTALITSFLNKVEGTGSRSMISCQPCSDVHLVSFWNVNFQSHFILLGWNYNRPLNLKICYYAIVVTHYPFMQLQTQRDSGTYGYIHTCMYIQKHVELSQEAIISLPCESQIKCIIENK